MDFGPLRTLVRALNFTAHGVPATLTRPFPDDTAIATRVIWLATVTDDVPNGLEFQRREARRVMAFRRDEVETVPRGSIIVAPEQAGGTDQRWRVDGLDHLAPDHVRVVVVPDPEPY